MAQPEIRSVIAQSYLGLSYVPMLECFQDQFVLKTLEYLACSRPVLATATRYTKHFSESIGGDRILLSDDTVDDMVEKILGADEYVNRFYSADNLVAPLDGVTNYVSALYNSPFSTRWFVIAFGTDSSLKTGPGWDNVTGLGTPNGSTFINAIAP